MFSEVCLTEATANKRHNLSLSLGLGERVRYLVGIRETQVLLISVVTA